MRTSPEEKRESIAWIISSTACCLGPRNPYRAILFYFTFVFFFPLIQFYFG